jgi:hypothetical protein
MVFDWLRTARPAAQRVEQKDAGYGFVALHLQGEAGWTRTDYAGLAREAYGRNPVVYRVAAAGGRRRRRRCPGCSIRETGN